MNNCENYKYVLFVGPNHNNHKGGIGAVLQSYNNNLSSFNFIPTYEGNISTALNLFFFIKSFFKFIWNISFNKNIKIVHLHSASKGSFYRKYIIFIFSKYIFRKKVIFHLHGGKFHLFYQQSNVISKKLISHFIYKSDHIICLSNSWKHFFEITFTKSLNITVLNNPIEEPLHIPINTNNNFLEVLFLGRIGKNKGIYDLIKVVSDNKYLFNGRLKLSIGGDGEVQKLLAIIENNSINDIVQYCGWVDGNKKVELLNKCDLLILPSYNEGLPISILEAMSYSKPVISTEVGGIPEIIHNQYNGILFTPGDLEAIKNALLFFLDNPSAINDFGCRSSSIISNYYPNKVFNSLGSIYSNILKGD